MFPLRWFTRRRTASPRHKPTRRVTPRVEQLEGRHLPAPVVDIADTSGNLYSLDAANATDRLIGNSGLTLASIAFDTSGNLFALTSAGALERLNPNNAAATFVGNTNFPLIGMDFSPSGQLFAVGSDGNLYRVLPNNGVTNLVGSLGGQTPTGDLAFDTSGNLYMISTANNLVKINTANGNTLVVGPVTGFTGITGLTFANGTLYGISNDSQQLLTINPQNGAGTVVRTLTPTVTGVTGAAFAANSTPTTPTTPTTPGTAATTPPPTPGSRLFVFLYPGTFQESSTGMAALQQRINSQPGLNATTFVFPYTLPKKPARQLPAARKLLTQVMKTLGVLKTDRVVLIGHSYGGNLARLLASDLRSDQPGKQPAWGLVTLDPLDPVLVLRRRHRLDNQSGVTRPTPTLHDVLNFVQRNGLEAFQGYSLLPGANDASLGAGPDGVWSTPANPSPDDTTHVLIDNDLGQAGETLGIYNRIIQLLQRVEGGL
jgi:hypothetical protein